MSIDPNTAVIVGVGQVSHKAAGLDDALTPAELMAEAIRRAAADAGLAGVPDADSLRVVSTLSWRASDPARELAAMLGITVFQTRMAQQQLQLDQLQVAVDKAQARHRDLVRSQADLRSPQLLGNSAHTLGMVPPSAVGFVTVDRSTYASVVAGSGALTDNNPDGEGGP